MVVKTIFDVADFQKKKKVALAKSSKTKLTAAETAKLKKQADKSLSSYKNLKVVELTKGGNPTGRYFLRGELKTKQGGTRWRILGKADQAGSIKKYGKVRQAVKVKPAKKARGKKTPATRRASSPKSYAPEKAKMAKMAVPQLRAEAKKRRPKAKLSHNGKALDKMQLIDLILTGNPGRHGRKSPKSPKARAKRASDPAPRKKSTGKKKSTGRKKSTGKKKTSTKKARKASPKQDLVKGLKKAELMKVAKHYKMRGVDKLAVADLRKKVAAKTEKEIKAAL